MHRLWKSKCRPCGYSDGVSCMSRLLTYLTSSIRFVLSTRAAVAGSSRRTTLTAILLLSVAQPSIAQAYESKDELIMYSHSRIIKYSEFKCFHELINKESNWNINAINGSHYGLGQMKSKHYRNLDGYRQIDASIKYIRARYQSPCKALTFFKANRYH